MNPGGVLQAKRMRLECHCLSTARGSGKTQHPPPRIKEGEGGTYMTNILMEADTFQFMQP